MSRHSKSKRAKGQQKMWAWLPVCPLQEAISTDDFSGSMQSVRCPESRSVRLWEVVIHYAIVFSIGATAGVLYREV